MNIISFSKSIKKIMNEHLEEEDFEYIFNGPINFNDFITQIMFEKYKEQYLINKKKKSLRSYIQDGQTFDSDYQQMKRTLAFSNYYKKYVKKNLTEQGVNVNNISDLEIHETKNMKEKLDGLSLSEMDNLQLTTMNRLELLKSITSKRIVSSKKISNTRFIEMFDELDNYYLNVKKGLNKDNFFYHLINFYDIERSYFTELIYKIATYINEQNLKEYNIESFEVLFNIEIPSIKFRGSNRFLNHRHIYIAGLINRNQMATGQLINVLYQKGVLFSHFTDKIDIAFKKLDVSDVEEHLMANYNLFNIITDNKEWNNNKIKIARSFYDKYLENVPLPKIRT